MIILTDVDGVLADFVGHIQSRAGVQSDIKEMDLRDSLTDTELLQVRMVAKKPGFCASMPWYPGAKNFFQDLMRLGHVYAVTSPWHSDTWASERRDWLHEGGLHPNRVISCPATSKPLIQGDVLVEDHPETAYDWLEVNKDSFVVLRDLPWNGPDTKTFQAKGDHPRMYRAVGYMEILRTIEGIKVLFK